MEATTTMKTMHTPGPWELRESGMGPFVTAAMNGYTPAGTVAQFPHPCDAHHAYQRTANARLVAAAPELLAACKDVVAAIADVLKGCDLPQSMSRALDAATYAIAKAAV